VRFATTITSGAIGSATSHATGDMPVDIVEHLSVPAMPANAVFRRPPAPSHRLWINPPSQQRGCLEYRGRAAACSW